jgi:hypothetical protein
MKRKMFLVSVLIIMSMWVSASASALEHTGQNNGEVIYTSPDLTITVLPKKTETLPKEIDGRNIIGYAVTNDYATVRETPNATGKIVRQLSPGNDIYIVGVENAWYEIYSKSGNTHGFVIEDVLTEKVTHTSPE